MAMLSTALNNVASLIGMMFGVPPVPQCAPDEDWVEAGAPHEDYLSDLMTRSREEYDFRNGGCVLK